MAFIQDGAGSGTLVSVDPTMKAARVTMRPVEVAGWYAVGASTGAYNGATIGSAVWSLRNLSSNLLMIRRLQVGFAVTTAFTTAQALAFGAFFARAFTVGDTSGTAIPLTGSQNKHRTSLATPTSVDLRVATTAGLSAGTRTLDTNPLGVAAGSAQALGASMPPTSLISHDTGDYPVILAQNEGLVLASLIAMGAAGLVQVHVNVEFAEVTAY